MSYQTLVFATLCEILEHLCVSPTINLILWYPTQAISNVQVDAYHSQLDGVEKCAGEC